ncbi:NADH-quinone oxidoreductase subunit D [Candidatus Bathyarchaeota archaeon]|nr:MAG: NADH-quinone oxidoreductase subunit D [Candidatus Bathyarchaeota archaeon]
MKVTTPEEEVIATMKAAVGDYILESKIPRPRRVYIRIKSNANKRAVSALLKAFPHAIISTITGVDIGEDIEINYHFWCGKAEVTIRTEVPKSNPEIETITDILPGAALYEREVHDLLGVKFTNHPSLTRLILPESWPKESYPLRKDWNPKHVGDLNGSLEETLIVGEIETERNGGPLVNVVVGPQHPALHEPERFLFKLDGEIVVDVEPRLGYAHRGIEKAAEQLMFFQDVHLVERVCGICNVAHTTCFCQAAEALGHIEVPPRALYLRTIVHELNRIHSHLLLLGIAGLEIGFESLFQYIWRDREIVLDLTEKLTGNRVMAEYSTIGGVRKDLTPALGNEIKRGLLKVKDRLNFYREVFQSDPTIELRTKDVGILSKEKALKLCVVGPVARGSGVKSDVRKHDPYAAYEDAPFQEILYKDGDSWARLMVRLDEVNESIDIILWAIDNIPGGPYRTRVPRRMPEGEALSRVEAPRGELVHYVRGNGTAYPERVKIRSPTLANIISFREMIRGCYVADIPAVLVSLDPCFSCTDRMVFVDEKSGRRWVWSMKDLRDRRRIGK